MRSSLLILIFILVNCIPVKSQEWIQTFTDGKYVHPSWIIETYDKGYVMLNFKDGYSWIIKADINGNKLWEKRIGDGGSHIYLENIEQTTDNGLILGGDFGKYSETKTDPVIIKFNPCCELEWCSVINTVGIYDFGTRVRQTPEGDYLLVSHCSDTDILPGEEIQLFKFDNNGNLRWKHTYTPDSLVWAPEPHDVRVDSDGYLISAMCYYPDSGNQTVGYERPYYIKTDTAGNLVWWLAFGAVNGYHGFTGNETIRSSNGNNYSTGWHSNYCDTPALVKCTNDGQESYFQDLLPGACPGGNGGVNWVDDSTFIILVGGRINGNNTTRWIKTDTFGITKYSKESPAWMGSTTHTTRTFDNKFINVAMVDDIWIYLYKLNSNLEYDSVYTYPFVYDSLCQGGVVSDTINPDCDLIVGIDKMNVETESGKLIVYPNPAIGNLTVEFPKYLKQTNRKSGISSTTVFYQWKSTFFEVYDLTGKIVFSKEIPKNEQKLEIDVSGWKPGMYYFRQVYQNQTISGEKVMIR